MNLYSTAYIHTRFVVDANLLILVAEITSRLRRKKKEARVGILLPDGRIDISETSYSSPSEAAKAVSGGAMNGWWFFLVQEKPRKSLAQVRVDYLQSIAADPDEDGEDDSDDQ